MENHENQFVSKEELEKLSEQVQKLQEALSQYIKAENFGQMFSDEFEKAGRAIGNR